MAVTVSHTPAVFFDDDDALASLSVGDSFELTGAEGKHAAQVLRVQPGEVVEVVDGCGLRLTGSVTQILASSSKAASGGTRVQLKVVKREVEPRPEVGLVLVQALAKGDRDLMAVATAVEVGVDEVFPWQAGRSVVVWRGDRAEKSHNKWRNTVVAAAKQARRAWFAPVQPAVTTNSLLDMVHQTSGSGGVVWVLDGSGDQAVVTAPLPTPPKPTLPEPIQFEPTPPEFIPLKSTLPEQTSPLGSNQNHLGEPEGAETQRLLIVVGPEGGYTAGELEGLQQAGAQIVRLGPHVMRTSTAGPIAVAIAAMRLGRWS